MKELYDLHGVRIFNFQDDNFFLPDRSQALQRLESLRDKLVQEGVEDIAIAIKARTDSITRESISRLNTPCLPLCLCLLPVPSGRE
jgi:hypothetical protein